MVDVSAAATKAAEQLELFEKEKGESADPVVETTSTEEEVTTPVEEVEDEVVEEPAKVVETIPVQRFNEVYGRMKELERFSKGLLDQMEVVKQTTKTPPPNFDAMTNAEIVDYMEQKTQSAVDQALKTYVVPMAEASATERYTKDIQSCAAKHSDFKTHLPVMIQLAEKHPTLAMEEVYQLASGNKEVVRKTVQEKTASLAKKKAARTETRSTASSTVVERPGFRSVKEIAFANAKKLGLV